jgi:hypothetical protein
MKKEIESIAFINRYLANIKDDSRKTKMARGYLTLKLNSMLSKFNHTEKNDFMTKVINMPLYMISI